MTHDLTCGEERRKAERRRLPPRAPVCLEARFDEDRAVEVDDDYRPDEIVVHATNEQGEIAEWLTDHWWYQFLQPWGEVPVTVKIMATPGALLHPVVLCQTEMLRRIAPRWRLVAYAYPDELSTEEDAATLARSAYHEVRFYAQAHVTGGSAHLAAGSRPIEELFGDIRRVQAEAGAMQPILVRLASTTPTNVETSRPHKKVLPL
jgi:hypothetical protein